MAASKECSAIGEVFGPLVASFYIVYLISNLGLVLIPRD